MIGWSGIALEEVDDHLLAEAGRRDGAPLLAGPRVRHADPARAVLVLPAPAVPVELHLHPPVLVRVDLLARRPDDDGRLRALHERLRRRARRPELLIARHRRERARDARATGVGQALVPAEPQVVGRGHDEVLPVLVLPRALLQREQVPGPQPPARRRGLRRLELAAELVHPDVGVLRAVGRLDVLAGVVVHLVVARRELPRLGLPRQQLDAGPLEVVVVVHVHARLDPPRQRPAGDVLAFRPRGLLRRDEPDLLVPRRGLVAAGRVRQHERVVAVGVPDVVGDALLLHQAADEVEVGLAVLHAVRPRAVAAGQLERHVVGRVVAEHLPQDVRHGLVLEDAAVGRAGEEPEPRPDLGPVAVVPAGGAVLAEARDVAIEVARRVLGQRQPHGHVLPQDLIEVDVAALADQVDPILAQPAQLLTPVHAEEHQHVLAKRRGDLHRPRHGSLQKATRPRAHQPRPAIDEARPGRAGGRPGRGASAAGFVARTTSPGTGTPNSILNSACTTLASQPRARDERRSTYSCV